MIARIAAASISILIAALAVRSLAAGANNVIVKDDSHLYNDTLDCTQTLSGLRLVPVAPNRATFTREEIQESVEKIGKARQGQGVGVISIESPVNLQ